MAPSPSTPSLSYTLIITGAPWVSQAPQTAWCFAEALLTQGHSIDRVFLYGEGAHLASALCAPPSDERHWPAAWSGFLEQHSIPGIVCVASALRRGLVDAAEQSRYELPAHNLRAPFQIAGLGEWVESQCQSDRIIYFHGSN